MWGLGGKSAALKGKPFLLPSGECGVRDEDSRKRVKAWLVREAIKSSYLAGALPRDFLPCETIHVPCENRSCEFLLQGAEGLPTEAPPSFHL